MITQKEALYCLKRELVALERVVIKRDTETKKTRMPAVAKAKETIEHVLLECEEIKPGVFLSTSLNKLLGFRDYQENLNGPAIENSKRRLEDWWKKAEKKNSEKLHE